MITINEELCIGCGLCKKDCVVRSLDIIEGKAKMIKESCLVCGHCAAICPVGAISIPALDEKEILDTKTIKKVASDDLLKLIQSRRSVRYYKEQAVEKEKIEKIIEAGRFTPTGCNVQATRYVIITNQMGKLRDLVIEGLSAGGRKYNSEALIQTAEKYKNEIDYSTLTFNAPHAVIIICGSSICNPINGTLAAESMELMIHSLDLGACYSGYSERGLNENENARSFLQMKDDEQVAACLYFGYPSVKYPRTVARKKAIIDWL